MKTKLLIAVSKEVVNTEEREFDLPEKPSYWSQNDDGNFFPRGLILFAILPKYEGKSNNYILVQVERGKQDSTDFVPTKDCRQEYWLKDYQPLRKTALEIFKNTFDEFKEITKEEFENKRTELLNYYFK